MEVQLEVGQWFHQGDIAVMRVDGIPTSVQSPRGWYNKLAEQEHNGRVVVALGESTGHEHAIEEDGGKISFFTRQGDDSDGLIGFVNVEGGRVTMTHDEHGAFTLPEGQYKVWHQREAYEGGKFQNAYD